jgi:hypothetical protein
MEKKRSFSVRMMGIALDGAKKFSSCPIAHGFQGCPNRQKSRPNKRSCSYTKSDFFASAQQA